MWSFRAFLFIEFLVFFFKFIFRLPIVLHNKFEDILIN